MRFDYRRADPAVAIEILMETFLHQFQCGAVSRHNAGDRQFIAAAVRVPDNKLINARELPGNLKAVCRLLCTNRCP